MSENLDVRISVALGKGAIVAAPLEFLLRAEGIPLDLSRGDHQAVVVFPSVCCSHSGARVVPPPQRSGLNRETPQPLYDTGEHATVVSGLRFTLEKGLVDAQTTLLPVSLNSPFAVTYGDLVAMGGDFYGSVPPDPAVCRAGSFDQQVAQFKKNFQQLVDNAPREVPQILAIANKYEFVPVEARLRMGWAPSGAYASIPTTQDYVVYVPGLGYVPIVHLVNDEDRAWDKLTGGTFLTNGRYLNLATINFDHFGADAITCYKAGHYYAAQEAIAAKMEQDPSKREMLLKRAYAINAFADHFLTDLFAAGHMRTPRGALYDNTPYIPPVPHLFGSILAKRMHDEDNKLGLWVTNSYGDTWVAYGDGRYRDKENSANRVIMKWAIWYSMQEIYGAFLGNSNYKNPNALAFIPEVITELTQVGRAVANRDDPRNWAPLFWRDPSSGDVYRREPPLEEVQAPSSYLPPGSGSNSWGYYGSIATFYVGGHDPRLPQSQFPSTFSYPPDDTGPTGEYGWPPAPTAWPGPMRPILRPPVGFLRGPHLYDDTGATALAYPGATTTYWQFSADLTPAPPDPTGTS